jgi:hypothetical protein
MPSAKKDALCLMPLTPKGLNNDHSTDLRMRVFRTFITNKNNIGDKGSPCRSPRAWQILSLGVPFSKTFVLARG